MRLAVWLLRPFFFQETVPVQLCEYILGDLCMLSGRCAPKYVEADFKPFINIGMYFVVLPA